MGLLDSIFGGGGSGSADDPYADILTPAQRNQMQVNGLLAMAGAFADAGMPSRLPIPFGSALGKAAQALGTGQNEGMKQAIENALAAQKVRDLRSLATYRQKTLGDLDPTSPLSRAIAAIVAPGGAAAPAAPSPGGATPPAGTGTSGVLRPTPAGAGAPAAAAGAPLTMDLPYPAAAGGGLIGSDVGAEGEYGGGQKLGGLLGPAPPDEKRADLLPPDTSANNLTQKQQNDAVMAATGRPLFPPGTKFNSAGFAVSGDLSRSLPGQRSGPNIPADVIRGFAQANALGAGSGSSSGAPAEPDTGAGGDTGWGPTFPQQAASRGPASGDPLDIIAHYESGNRNIPQQVLGPQGGYNPSVGRVTGPSSAGGPWQMIDPTWRAAAQKTPGAEQYPTALSAPVEVQRKVAQTLFDEQGYAPWAPYNATLARAIGYTGGRGPAGETTGGGEDAGWGPTFAQGGPDRVIPSGPGAGGNPMVQLAQYAQPSAGGAPGGAAVPGMPQLAPPPQLGAPGVPGLPGAPAQGPGLPQAGAADPRVNALLLELARRNAASEVLGLGTPYSSLLTVLQGSPQYKAAVESATAAARIAQEEPSKLRTDAAKARLDMIQKLGENALTLDKDNNVVEIPGMRDMLGRTAGEIERAKQQATSQFQLTDARVIGPDGQPTTTKMPIYEYIFRQQQAARNASMGAKPQPGDIISAPISGPPPEGFEYRMDPNGKLTAQAIPGTPAEQVVKDRERKQAVADQATLVARDVVVQNAGRVEDLVQNSTLPVTGTAGPFLSRIAGTAANDTRVLLDTIKSRSTLDTLNALRAASPTGGALGSVSDQEDRLLASAISSLDQSQSKEQFLFNLRRVKQYYIDAVHGPGTYSKLSDEPVLKVPAMGAARPAPAIGTIQDGHSFKGGNPADPNSWQKVP